MNVEVRRQHQETRAGWDRIAASKYRAELPGDVALLQRGGHTFLPIELDLLLPELPRVHHAIHLQCSHGLDALGLLNLGVPRVTGIDISAEMIRLAEEKTASLGAAARWVCSDVLEVPDSLDGSADLVFTGKGALPWILDLEEWSAVVARLLRHGGLFYAFEGHPLAAVWDRDADVPRMPENAAGYFESAPFERTGFPADALRQLDPAPRLPMREQHWRAGQVIGALQRTGMQLQHFDEYPDAFWPQFPRWTKEVSGKLPMSYAILARKGR